MRARKVRGEIVLARVAVQTSIVNRNLLSERDLKWSMKVNTPVLLHSLRKLNTNVFRNSKKMKIPFLS